MIDYEQDIITAVREGLAAASMSEVVLFDQTILTPSEFPCVCIEEIDNYTYRKTIDSGGNEHHVRVAYEVNVYSNRTYDKRGECKSIFAAVSDVLTGLGFSRNSRHPAELNKSTAYRLVGRFMAVIDEDGNIARR